MNRETYLSEFHKCLDKMVEITESKNADYASEEDAFMNFKAVNVFGLTTEAGFITRMTDKLMRISNLTTRENKVSDEKITDTLLDLSIYSILFKIYLQSKQK